MRIQDYFKTDTEIVALDWDFVAHFIPIKDMYNFLIDNKMLEYDIHVDGKPVHISMTFDDWFKEQKICAIDLETYIDKHYRNKKS